ncbi:translation initiation factor IF-2 [Enterobacteriaceae endosymbiont of Donacia crassipes]|uniref:translation initiation factor IF-2 n=1 Tax=Enterobacteriaceae endosymbiont of Donacia crassipes TaxID=2675776 RepID=UPI001449DF88|nr:translation initiation factor IF-2 [Enterobacteriaceae endosymbiont of Donacia crassipes]QJC34597.1 translation initiation factor IF-2 [Enterobacteriaceae endosymbiont of Donacia crassipes]
MIDAVITIKSLANEIKISVKKIIQYFSNTGISKLENDIINKEEKKKLLTYLKNKNSNKLEFLNIQKNNNNVTNLKKIKQKKILINNNNKNKLLFLDKKNYTKEPYKTKTFNVLKTKKKKFLISSHKHNYKKINIIKNNIDYKKKKSIKLNKKKIFYNKNLNHKNTDKNFFKKNIYNKKKYNKNYKNSKENNKKIIFNKYKKKKFKLYQNFNKPIKNINRNIIINETISIIELSNKMAVKSSELIKVMINMGEKYSDINQLLDQETAQLIAEEMGHKVILHHENDIEQSLINNTDLNSTPIIRSPIVTIIGHVDHGKTSLLDYICSSNVAAKEAGGITQNIDAYEIVFNNKKIVFFDTPGHESFISMRLRGVQITDIILLVIAIDDGVMPQTIEAIQHAKAMKVPIIVAINKIDKKISNFEKIKNELSRYNIISEEWGGRNIFVKISAKTGEGINKLLKIILLQTEMLELKAINKGIARGIVIESFLEKGKGPIANVLIKEGMLKKGDIVLCGCTYGKIKCLINYKGSKKLYAGPSTPIKILGLSELPYAGDNFIVVNNEKQAKEIALYRKNKLREVKLAHKQKQFQKLFLNLNKKNIYEIILLIKSDTQGSLEAIKNTLLNLSNDKINIKVIHCGIGEINETDISLVITNSSKHIIIIGFNIKQNNIIRNLTKIKYIKVMFFTIIYDLINYMKKYIQNLLMPKYKELILGNAEVRSIFTIPKIGVIAGCIVTYGLIKRNNLIKLFRNNQMIHEGIIDSLRRFKESVHEVRNGMECGISIKNFNNIYIGDKIEIFEKTETIKK